MNAAFIQQTGPPEVIQFGSLPDPTPTADQVVIQVEAVSVNPIDTYIRAGAVAMKLPMPFVVGCDLAGTIVELGSAVKAFRKGDHVWASNQGLLGRQGTFSTLAAVDAKWVHRTPDGVASTAAAAVALVGITSHLGLVTHARLKPGETLFVNGGSGGVGSMVIQMGRALGARVIASAGSEEKVALCRQLGADEAFNYKTADPAAALKALAPAGIHVWWETTREPDFARAVPLLAPRARFILMAGREAHPEFPVGPFYVKNCSLHGFAMFNHTAEEQSEAGLAIGDWLASGRLRSRIDRVLPLSAAAEAHRLQESNTLARSGVLAGKLVLVP